MNKDNQEIKTPLNVLGKELEVCSCKPLTGWYRDGYCKYDPNDGASYYLELLQDAAGEGIDLSDTEIMDELQEEIIEFLEDN